MKKRGVKTEKVIKYCYKCGTEHDKNICPDCGGTLSTSKPNSQTKLQWRKSGRLECYN